MDTVFTVLAVLQALLCAVLIGHVLLQLTLARSYLGAGTAETPPRAPGEGSLPVVTIQLPLYNERNVVERLIDRVTELDWPRDRLEIQVLDDSTDETVALAAAKVAHYRALGFDIRHIRRPSREGFKAGALKHGLESARGEFVAIFDAEFLPDPAFLRLTVPHFADPKIGLVQTRWAHANREASLLTRVQGMMLDTHLTVEQVGRTRQHCFFNFNGTSGIWRAAAIRSAGNWSGDTLTEDLDLSYRAQLAGWRFVYLDRCAATGDLPDNVRAFRSQQYRWIKGGAQCAARLLPRVLRANVPQRVKLQACEHLLETSFYLVFLVLLVLTAPMAALTLDSIEAIWAVPVLLFALSMGSLIAVYAAPQRAELTSLRGVARFLALWNGFMVVSTGMVVHNGLAALSGLLGRGGEFVRTPKRDTAQTTRWNRGDSYLPKGLGRTFVLELALWLYLGVAIAIGAFNGTLALLLGPIMAFLGLTYMLALCLGDFAEQRLWTARHAEAAPAAGAGDD
ncbi:MAG: glycosyltransferase [Rhodospirillaceae bacterium]|nr:glycosyltransferase [Rhodospirillaceae bacterium]